MGGRSAAGWARPGADRKGDPASASRIVGAAETGDKRSRGEEDELEGAGDELEPSAAAGGGGGSAQAGY